jgi:benzoyl-CoA reductase/2-hydroxyglutaryl-CoA dehydratase subunit BcrC/BadD/HgdB
MTQGEERPQGRFGWICSYTPVEILWAAGYLPVRLLGGESVPRSHDPRIYHLLCPFVRAVFHRYSAGESSSLAGVVFVRCCDGMVRLHDVWREFLSGRADLLDLPKNASPEAVRFFAEVLRKWSSDLGQGIPRPGFWEDLKRAIARMNEARTLFQEISRSQRDHPESVPYSQAHLWTRRWLAEPTDEVLKTIRGEWNALPVSSVSSLRPRVLLTSSMLDQPGLIGLLDRAGLNVVSEDECMGARHFDGLVSETGDPFLALAERYLLKWPCPRMKGHERRLERLDREMGEGGVQGVVAVQLKFCDQSGFDLPLLREHLERRGIPLLVVENDYGEGSLGQLRVRIEAFAEMLQQDWA